MTAKLGTKKYLSVGKDMKEDARIKLLRDSKAAATDYVKMCPKCNSVNVNLNQHGGLAFFGLPAYYTCKECGYTNNFFPEIRAERLEKVK